VRKIDALRDLQQLDSARDRAYNRLRQIEVALNDRSAIASAEAERDRAHAARVAAETAQRDLELQLQTLRDRLAREERRLYSGEVRNPRELQDIDEEVAQLRRQVSEREERLIPLMDATEVARRQEQAALAQLASVEEAARNEREELLAEQVRLQRELASLNAQRPQYVARCDPTLVPQYERLRQTRAGLAVVPVQQRACTGCHISLPVSEEQRVRSSSSVVTCKNCGRFLYFP